ncbi:GDSL esterase/lipase At1g33811 isoform X1 [Salvia miltiorrhiza]|uniref:GDSL esterase/lipase At1g33811 isoform X1 n=1 Tax=Salvia miltiorrhiza TaxID=226208 RepID=UPI0025ABBE06|nr:GDSL esterase/lipase At1g33811 isoform X1 [Salvia miltiorrhiza]
MAIHQQYYLWAMLLSLYLAAAEACNNNGCSQVPGFFIFGDSLVDNGNNNDMLTLARADYSPYGVDFPNGATGRFTNGRTFVDVLAQLLGFPNYIPPYAEARGRALLQGANYASGASGIRDETGNNLGDHASMNQQVMSFAKTVQQLRRYFNNANSLCDYLSKCIFYAGLGSNDYLNNYFMRDYYSTADEYTPSAFAASLLHDYTNQLTELYNLGARKVVVAGVGPIGCIPYQLARFDGKGSRCNDEINSAISLFNAGLRRAVDAFNRGRLPGARFVYLDSFQSSQDLVENATSYGFEVIDEGCCGVGRNNGQITCLPLQMPCDERWKYVFWDAFHPTEAANVILAKRAYASKTRSHAYPINIQHLALL